MNGAISDTAGATGWLPEGFAGELLPFVLESWDVFRLPNHVRGEEQITGLFRKELKKRVRRSGNNNWIFLPEMAVEDDAGIIIGYPDLPVLHRDNLDDECAFIFECKRLHITSPGGSFSHSADYYVDDGMMRFIKGQYCRHVCEAAMLGYVMNANTTGAQKNVVKAIRARRFKLMFASGGQFSLCKLLKSVPPHGETRHKLGDGRNFILYHLLVPVRRVAA